MKKCTKCGVEKDEKEFYKESSKKDGLKNWCKKCCSDVQKQRLLRPKTKERKKRNARPGYKYCSKCGAERSITEFHKRSETKDGLVSNCKKCCKEYLNKNEKHIKQRRKRYYRNNKQRFKKLHKEYRTKHKKELNKYNLQYSKDNKEKINRKNREKYKYNINFKLSMSLRRRLYCSLKMGRAGSAVFDLGCTIEELKKHLESKFEEGMTWENWGRGENFWHIDHIKPLHMFDLTDRKQFLEVCHYTNLRPLWEKDNLCRTYEEFNENTGLVT